MRATIARLARIACWPLAGAAVARRPAGAAAAALVTAQEIARRSETRRLALADLRRQLRQPSLQPADADHAGERQPAVSRSGRSRPPRSGNFETTTLLRDNVLYVTGPQNVAWAIDARTGRQIWRYRRELPATGLTACCGLVNRGFGALGDKLFMTTLDAHLLALDMKTGAVVWDATLEDYKNGYASTIAPLVVKDKVIVGVAGGEYGIRGFIDAYDAQTGKRAWRFYTIPGPGEPGNNTWAGDSWKSGGTGVWVTGAYDPGAEPASSTAPAIRAPTTTARAARATTCTAARWSRSTPTPASSAGTTSSRRTTCTTGTRPRCRFSPT